MAFLRWVRSAYHSIPSDLRAGIITIVAGLILVLIVSWFDLENRKGIGDTANAFLDVFPWLGWIGLVIVLAYLVVRSIRHSPLTQVRPRVKVTSNSVLWEYADHYLGDTPGLTGPMCPADQTLLVHSQTRKRAADKDVVDGVNDDFHGSLECPTCSDSYKFDTAQRVEEAYETAVLLIDSKLRRQRDTT